MPIRQKQFPVRFTPKGLVDALDATDKFPGACLSLQNLIFDPQNPEIVISRPGVTQETAFPGFSSAGFVSVHITIGDVIFGMVATTRNVGHDEPFCYNHATGAFITVSNVTNANTPTSPSTSGAWTPPTMTNVGTMVLVTHPGFPGGATKFGWFDITTPSAPVWNAGDTATSALPSVPLAVANFGNRAYFACTNSLPYTDVLTNPPTRTNSTQSLTVGDSTSITALFGLPVQTTSSGVVQALIVFKAFQIWQVTGDTVTSNLSLNFISLTFGTQSPRSVAQSPMGLYFAAIAGPKIIDSYGNVRSVTSKSDQIDPDIDAAWQNASTPSRIAAAYSSDIYRICIQTTLAGATSTNDYWFNERKRRWTGAHTFPYDCASQHQDHFIVSGQQNPGAIFHSQCFPTASTVYTDNSASFTSAITTATFPKTQDIEMNQVVESTIELASNQGAASYQITAVDEMGNTLNSAQISVSPSGALWGSGVWGGFKWASGSNIPITYTVPWGVPLVFNKMKILIQATATTQLSIGTFFARYQKAGYRLALGGRQ